jgi:hypothetical protein
VGLKGVHSYPSETPIVGNGHNATDSAMTSERRCLDIFSGAQETSMASNFLPPSAPTRTGDEIVQHFINVRKD